MAKKKDEKAFKVLLGRRVAIANFFPEEDEPNVKKSDSGIILLPQDQKKKDQEKASEQLISTERFRITQVGTDCMEHLQGQEGCEVDIEDADRYLHPETAHTIIKDSKIIAFIVPERVITGIY